MKPSLCLVILLASMAYAAPCPTGQAKDEATLIQLEHTWAEALERHDAEAVGCLLAPEFEDADPEGWLHDRTETLAHIPHRRARHNTLSEMHAHLYGDVAYVRGMSMATDAEDKMLGKVRFTDIFVYREGRWLAVAGQETLQAQKP